jgi:hypothetical protein
VTHRGTVGTGVLIAALAVSGVADARAQTAKPTAQRQPARPRPAFRPGSIEFEGGVLWLSGIAFGSTTAAIAANRTPAAEYPLFNTTGELKAGPAYEGRVGVRLTRMIGVEGAFQYSRQALETRITNDVENAAGVTASNDLSRYVFEVSGVVHLTALKVGKGGSPFVLGGFGYMRELDDEQALVETGRLYHAGGGFKYLFSSRTHGLVKGLGLRADARLYFRDGGFTLADTDELRRYFAGGASLLVAF